MTKIIFHTEDPGKQQRTLELIDFLWKPEQSDIVSYGDDLIREGVDLQVQNSDGWRLLHMAAASLKDYVIPALVSAGADIEGRNTSGLTPLLLALEHRNDRSFQALLTAGADAEAKNNAGSTSVHMAARRGQNEILKKLLAAGADVEARNNDGLTPLHLVASMGRTKTVRTLLDAGATVYSIHAEDEKILDKADDDTKLVIGMHLAQWQPRHDAFLVGHFHPKTQADWLGLASVMPLHDPKAHNPVALRVEWLKEYYKQPALRELHKQANTNAAQGWQP